MTDDDKKLLERLRDDRFCNDWYMRQEAADAIERLAPPSPADMRAFGASEAACYKWPDDTPEHKACRAAYVEGAYAAQPVAPPSPEIERIVGEIEKVVSDTRFSDEYVGIHIRLNWPALRAALKGDR